MTSLHGILRAIGYGISFVVIILSVVFLSVYFELSKKSTILLVLAAAIIITVIRFTIFDKARSPISLRRSDKNEKETRNIWLFRLAGMPLILIGAFLHIGNRTGIYTSIPFTGTILIVLGVLLLVLGQIKSNKGNTADR